MKQGTRRRWVETSPATLIVAGLTVALAGITAGAAEPAALIKTIQSIDKRAKGSVEAGQALAALSNAEPATLLAILAAFSDANPLAANYLRSAVETIADRAISGGKALPQKPLEAFIGNRKNDPRARRLAYDILQVVDKTIVGRLIPGMLTDPSPEFRRDAVARLLDLAGQLQRERQQDLARTLYKRALRGATDDDQVKAIVDPLRKLGEKINLPEHFGFLTDWHIIGPFDNDARKGFAVVYGPEKKLDLKTPLAGQLGETKWLPYKSAGDFGILDIAKIIKPYKGVVMYCTTVYESKSARPIELRLGTPNAWKLWVNGKLAFAREEYHRGMKLDQYRVPCQLRAGANTILLKLCQNQQKETWAQRYQFQLRACDKSGIAILSTDRSAALPTSKETQP
ncbi:MAG: hypothetical protein CMJ65_03110 [Planctomycetaceae bacterium]|jgi:hypothetical protein|nr:hypothetical protein [Planctomycetaceae bacterium]MDP7277596.1 hypothetical protein [Planctomycetaceae bacterium]